MIPKENSVSEAGWDDYFARVRTLNRNEVESKVLEYKRVAEQYLRSEVTDEVLSSKENWINAARKHLGPLGDWRRVIALAEWWDDEPERASAALRGLWAPYDGSPEGLPPRDEVITRIRTFAKQLPRVKNLSGAGERMGLISALLIRISAEHYPPFGVEMFRKAYDITDYPKPPKDADEATLYKHALEFLDKFVEEARARRLEWPCSILEAQSVVYMLR